MAFGRAPTMHCDDCCTVVTLAGCRDRRAAHLYRADKALGKAVTTLESLADHVIGRPNATPPSWR